MFFYFIISYYLNIFSLVHLFTCSLVREFQVSSCGNCCNRRVPVITEGEQVHQATRQLVCSPCTPPVIAFKLVADATPSRSVVLSALSLTWTTPNWLLAGSTIMMATPLQSIQQYRGKQVAWPSLISGLYMAYNMRNLPPSPALPSIKDNSSSSHSSTQSYNWKLYFSYHFKSNQLVFKHQLCLRWL